MGLDNPVIRMLIGRLQQNPDIMNNQNAREMLNVVLTGDSKRGEEIANNILQSNGVSKEQALSQAQTYFSNMFGGSQGGTSS